MHIITTKPLSLSTLRVLVFENTPIELSEEVIQNIKECRTYLNQKIAATSDPIYGINTGFGSLCDVRIHSENLTKLQENLDFFINKINEVKTIPPILANIFNFSFNLLKLSLLLIN